MSRGAVKFFVRPAGLAALLLTASAVPAVADTSAGCSTDTATSYCEQLSTGVATGGLTAGLDTGLIVLAALLVFLVVLWMGRRAAAAVGA